MTSSTPTPHSSSYFLYFLSQLIATIFSSPSFEISEEFGNESITISLELTVENSEISVEPQALDLTNLGPTRIQLILSYNTLYNVSATATLCGQNITHFIGLHYGKSISFKFDVICSMMLHCS